MENGGVQMGLSPDLARQLTLQTFMGASVLAASSEVPPEHLKRQVTSPKGTTEAALKYFDEHGLEKLIIEGMKRAKARSEELAS
jgi:pyrroline-5-carboxylate reductase